MPVATIDRSDVTIARAAGRSISVIVTAMNEEGNLGPTLAAVVSAVAPRFPRYEVIVVDDGSRDRTADIADALAAQNPRIRVHRNGRNLGLGRSYQTGIDLASYEYTAWVAGNNLVPREALARICDHVGERDMVISYIFRDVRGFQRRTMSRAFTTLMNLLFSVRMRYYTGPCVYKSAVAKQLTIKAQGSLFVAELLVRLLRAGQTYVEVGLQPLPRSSGSTKTFRLRNVVDVFLSVMRLFWEIRVARAFRASTSLAAAPSSPRGRAGENDPAVHSR
jgi:glycosyltransferase involved in cell wall biosynthesis